MPKTPLPSLALDTAGLPADSAFALWAEAMVGYEVSRPDPSQPFGAQVQAWMLGPMVISRSRLGAVLVARTERQIARDLLQHYSLVLPLEGAWEVSAEGRRTRSQPGIVTIFDNERPYTSVTTSLDVIVAMVERQTIAPMLGDADLHLHHLDHQAGRLLADHLALLTTHLPFLSAADAPLVAQATTGLIVSSLRAGMFRPARAGNAASARRALRMIDDRLGADLTPDRLRAELNVSRATLFRLFAPFGGVARFIRQRRLTRIHALVAAGEPFAVKQLASAFGFSGGAQLSRAFRARFGYSITALAARAVPLQTDPGRSGASGAFRRWVDRLG